MKSEESQVYRSQYYVIFWIWKFGHFAWFDSNVMTFFIFVSANLSISAVTSDRFLSFACRFTKTAVLNYNFILPIRSKSWTINSSNITCIKTDGKAVLRRLKFDGQTLCQKLICAKNRADSSVTFPPFKKSRLKSLNS